MIFRSLSRRVAESLEHGRFSGRLAQAGALGWQRFASATRPLSWPRGVKLIGVGGAVLGGSGKTPLAACIAETLRARGVQVALVASSYPARASDARVVQPTDDYRRVGDEALMLARRLTPKGVAVAIGPSRTEAVALAAELAPVVVVDGLLQSRPTRLSLSLLALDGREPWGAARCPPAGDLRAAADKLLEACDAVVYVSPGGEAALHRAPSRPTFQLQRSLVGARMPGGELLSVAQLSRLRVGACLGVARPGRVLDMLGAAGLQPEVVWLAGDHRAPRPTSALASVDLWLTTPKCALKLPGVLSGRPVGVLEVEWALDKSLNSLVYSRSAAAGASAFSCVNEAVTTW